MKPYNDEELMAYALGALNDPEVLGEQAKALLRTRLETPVKLCRRRSGASEAEECGLPYGHEQPHHPRAMFVADLAVAEQLRDLLPSALAAADDAGSDEEDWIGSEYVDRIATAVASQWLPVPTETLVRVPSEAALHVVINRADEDGWLSSDDAWVIARAVRTFLESGLPR